MTRSTPVQVVRPGSSPGNVGGLDAQRGDNGVDVIATGQLGIQKQPAVMYEDGRYFDLSAAQ